MDIGLPHKNGFDLANELRSYCSDAKFVAITGYTQADIVRRSRAAGFAKVLIKPAAATELKEAVEAECSPSSTA